MWLHAGRLHDRAASPGELLSNGINKTKVTGLPDGWSV